MTMKLEVKLSNYPGFFPDDYKVFEKLYVPLTHDQLMVGKEIVESHLDERILTEFKKNGLSTFPMGLEDPLLFAEVYVIYKLASMIPPERKRWSSDKKNNAWLSYLKNGTRIWFYEHYGVRPYFIWSICALGVLGAGFEIKWDKTIRSARFNATPMGLHSQLKHRKKL
jgi:hypothetical protein